MLAFEHKVQSRDTWKPLHKLCLTLCPVPVLLWDHQLLSTSPLPTLTVQPRVKGSLIRGERQGVFSGCCSRKAPNIRH